ncbi:MULTISPECIES: hypothetical protein [unclassified Streptomyces]|uniref:hypothetical protein n=1 Tax=unclassified Streptomyces TaxID=2593676 RepID=UPI00143E5717|nr:MULTISPECIES: hypothetical protein [unclassified Streptomyces]QIY66423.1 hypothetical protein HEP85_39025 [Streptomyces sp. RPA4-2]
MGKRDETAPDLLNIGDAYTFDCGLKLSFTSFQAPDMDEKSLQERAKDEGMRGPKGSLNFFQVNAVVENVGSKKLTFDLHYQYHYARVGDPARKAAGLDDLDGALFDVVLHPGRRLAGYFLFASKTEWGDRVEVDSKIYLEPSLTTLSSVWRGRLPGAPAALETTPRAQAVSQPVSASAATVAAVQAEMRKRDEGRRIALENPRLALELGIGDPDRHAGFDDGGLIDINGVAAETLSRAFRLSADAASRIVGARARVGGAFTSVEEIVLYAELSSREEQLLQERAVVLPW